MSAQYAERDGIKICYETLGDPTNETIIFISGLGSHLVFWTDEFCQRFLDRGFHIIRFDNRDVGLSHKTPGEPPSASEIRARANYSAPYSLSDMADDTISVLDAVGIEQAHVVGTSLGGAIAQMVAIDHPDRVKTVTIIMSGPHMSSTIEAEEEDQATRDEAVAASLTMDMSDPATYVDIQVEGWRVTSGPHFDPEYQRSILQKSFDRCYHPNGWAFQMLAVSTAADRTPMLKELTMPALVIHGGIDPLVPPAGGKALAAAIPNSRLVIYDDMGHNLPRPRWDDIAQEIADLAAHA